MKNADMPAMPTRDAIEDCGPDGSQGPHMVEVSYGGLTKREYLAAMALPRIDVHIDDGKLDGVAQQAAKMAVETADALLAELEKTS